MNCAGFERWLDMGMPEAEASAANDHASSCPVCRRAQEAARAIERLLGADPHDRSWNPPPVGFTDAVMAKVAAEGSRFQQAAGLLDLGGLPWWIRSLQEPSMVLAALLLALLIGFGDRLRILGETIGLSLDAWLRTSLLPVNQLALHPWTILTIAVLVAAGMSWLSLQLFHLVGKRFARRFP